MKSILIALNVIIIIVTFIFNLMVGLEVKFSFGPENTVNVVDAGLIIEHYCTIFGLFVVLFSIINIIYLSKYKNQN